MYDDMCIAIVCYFLEIVAAVNMALHSNNCMMPPAIVPFVAIYYFILTIIISISMNE